jgi:hypothetical protein
MRCRQFVQSTVLLLTLITFAAPRFDAYFARLRQIKILLSLSFCFVNVMDIAVNFVVASGCTSARHRERGDCFAKPSGVCIVQYSYLHFALPACKLQTPVSDIGPYSILNLW